MQVGEEEGFAASLREEGANRTTKGTQIKQRQSKVLHGGREEVEETGPAHVKLAADPAQGRQRLSPLDEADQVILTVGIARELLGGCPEDLEPDLRREGVPGYLALEKQKSG